MDYKKNPAEKISGINESHLIENFISSQSG